MLLRVSERSDIEEEGASRRVRVRLPPWLGGNDILQPVGEAELKATPVDASTFWWQLETRESHEHRSPRLMTLDDLAGPGQPSRWDRLRSIPDPGIRSPLPREQLLAERNRIIRERPGDFAACATALSLFVSTSGEGPPIAGAHTAAATTWWVAQMNSSCRKSATSPTIAMPMGRSCRVGCSRRS